MLHPYGRYCNANKFAGEVDTLRGARPRARSTTASTTTASSSAASRWAARPAGSSPSTTPASGPPPRPAPASPRRPSSSRSSRTRRCKPTWYEQKLWHLYDCTDYAANLFNCPTVAYSGEIDAEAGRRHDGQGACRRRASSWPTSSARRPGTRYQPEAKAEINRRIDAIVAQGPRPGARARSASPPGRCATTAMHWVRVDGLEQHWERARVDADDRTATTASTVDDRRTSPR